jgi:hypothetical protein
MAGDCDAQTTPNTQGRHDRLALLPIPGTAIERLVGRHRQTCTVQDRTGQRTVLSSVEPGIYVTVQDSTYPDRRVSALEFVDFAPEGQGAGAQSGVTWYWTADSEHRASCIEHRAS